MKISIDQIVVSKDNPRQSFDEDSLRRLGESIKEHGLLQPIIVRPKGSFYELVVGERRFRACALLGFPEIEAEVMDVDDVTAMELRLIENCHREDLTDAEKGDAVYALWAMDKYETIKEVADAIQKPDTLVWYNWCAKSRKLSPKLLQHISGNVLSESHSLMLLKYSHKVQEKFANLVKTHHLTRNQLIELTKKYDANPSIDLEQAITHTSKTIEIPKSMLTEEQVEKLEEKKQLAKTQRIRKKPSKPITKEQVRKKLKKTDFKFEPVKISHGSGKVKPPTPKIKPNILGTTKLNTTPDWTLCKCPTCPLFGKHCKGRRAT